MQLLKKKLEGISSICRKGSRLYHVEYKKRFVQTQWPDEKYKWEAVKCFQVNWDVNSDDFAGMLTKALSQTGNLLASVNNFPAKMTAAHHHP